jgi:hypothetical protein
MPATLPSFQAKAEPSPLPAGGAGVRDFIEVLDHVRPLD